MHKGQVRLLSKGLVLGFSIVSLAVLLPQTSASIFSYAQSAEKVRHLAADFISENDCPVSLVGAKSELDLDPFDAPIDVRLYFTYKNVSPKPIEAVKFRVRFVDNSGKDLGTFHAPDGALVEAGQERTQKWKTERIYPGISALKVRVLQVRYADGAVWQSAKMPEIPNPASGS